MLAEIQFDYWQKFTREQVAMLAEHTGLEVDKICESEADDEGKFKAKSFEHHIIDLVWLDKHLRGVKYEVNRLIKHEGDFSAIFDRAVEALEKIEKLPFIKEQDFNSKVNVHVPNLGLLLMDEVDWLEDACTERLQDRLDEGWRILAICPQPDQRRPDYILGRTKR